MSNDVLRRMAHGAVWMLLFKLIERSLGVISTMMLVRLLSPVDFGIVAMSTSFIFMAELLTAFGFDVALIQKQDATEEHYNTAWTCNLLLGSIVALLMLTAARSIGSFYNQPQAALVVSALAFGPLITGLENIGVVVFRKEMQFRNEFALQASRKVIGFIVVVPLAFTLRSYWALVAGILASKLAGTVISYLIHPFRPRFSLAGARALLSFSKWLLFSNIVNFFKERSSDFVIGRGHGASSLGLYSVSYELANLPMTELSAPVNRALLPGFSRIATDVKAIRTAYTQAVGLVLMLAIPAAAGIAAVAPFLAPVVLGPRWLSAVPLLEILAINGGLLLFHSSICTLLIAAGYPDRVTKTNTVYVLLLLFLFGLLIPTYGVTGAAWAALVASAVATPLYLLQIRESVSIPFSVFLKASTRPLIGAFAMAVLVRWALPDWTNAISSMVSVGWLIGGVLLGITSYAAVALLLWRLAGRPDGPERLVIEEMRRRLGRQIATAATTR